jgi:hypothetical protein
VAKSFRLGACCSRAMRHVNNPVGGMGMNDTIHDAFNLSDKLAEVWGRRR